MIEPRPPVARRHCRHYDYEHAADRLRGGGATCAVGIDNRTAPGASGPCMPPKKGETMPRCPRREEWTGAERAATIAYEEDSMRRMSKIIEALPGPDRTNWGKVGTLPCPGCGLGVVRWTRARSNGHLWAHCSTPDCFGIIQ